MSVASSMTEDLNDRWRNWVLIISVVVFEAIVLSVWAGLHGVNADEGFYLAGGWHVAHGRQLYRDVFFPQMPYLPWMEAVLLRWCAPSLAVVRGISIVGGALSAGVVAGLVWRLERSIASAVVVAILYAFSGMLLNGLAIGKTYGLANGLLLSAFAVLTVAAAPRPLWAGCAGIAAACAIGVRLAAAPAVAVMALMAGGGGAVVFGAFVAGGVLGSLPWLWAAVHSPAEFWFGNVTFHALRREITGPVAILLQKLGIVAKWLFLPQHVVLWTLVIAGCWLAPRRVWPAAACALVLALTYAAATPTYLEYMAQFVPFALIAAAPAVSAALTRRPMIVALVVAAYVLGAFPLFIPNVSGSERGSKRDLWRRSTVDQIVSYIREQTAPTDRVLSWWEGYPILSQRPGYIGVGFWESNMAKKLPPETARKFHVRQIEDIRELVREGDPAVIVVDDGDWDSLRQDIERKYVPAQRVYSIQVYTRRPVS